jgi:hypothetical protein
MADSPRWALEDLLQQFNCAEGSPFNSRESYKAIIGK